MVDKWVRESVVCFVLHLIGLVGHVLFLLLTVPSRANKNFPYHVRTTQIGIMEITDGVAGNNSLDAFGHHPYAPGGPPSPWPRVPVGLFTIAQSNCSVSTNGNSMLVRRQSMAVRRVYTPESLVLRHEEILPNANFMACMIRAELQPNNRSNDITAPLQAITERSRESEERAESIGNSEERSDQPRNNQRRRSSEISAGEGTSGTSSFKPQERNPFIITTTNQSSSNSKNDANSDDEKESPKNEILKKSEVEESSTYANGDIDSSEENLKQKYTSRQKDSPQINKTNEISNNHSTISLNGDRDSDEQYDANIEESFAMNVNKNKFNRELIGGPSIASFPRDENLRSSIRKLPPLHLTEEMRNSPMKEIKSNGVHSKPVYSRTESRVHFQL